MSVDDAIDAMMMTVLGGDATLATLAPGGVWRGLAPEGTAGTVVVFSNASGTDDYTLKTRAYTVYRYLVKAIAPGESSVPANNAASRIDALLSDATPTLASGTLMSMRREQTVSMPEARGGETYQHAGGYYTIYAKG
jgi:hypothetical protein